MEQVDVAASGNDGPNPQVSEATRHAFLDLLLEEWPRIAAMGWLGFTRAGRGVVVMQDGAVPAKIAYRLGAPCDCHADTVARYHPDAEVVVAVQKRLTGRTRWVGVLSGWPAPRAAAARVSPARPGAEPRR